MIRTGRHVQVDHQKTLVSRRIVYRFLASVLDLWMLAPMAGLMFRRWWKPFRPSQVTRSSGTDTDLKIQRRLRFPRLKNYAIQILQLLSQPTTELCFAIAS